MKEDKDYPRISASDLDALKNMKRMKKIWYLSACEVIYKDFEGIRLTDAQLARLLAKKYGGEERHHLDQIRRTKANHKDLDYVRKNI